MTKLKRTVTSLDDVEEQYRGCYRQDGEKFVLDVEVEGTTSNKTLKEFRDSNTKMKERLEAYGDKEFGGGEIEPERVTELLGKQAELDDFEAKGENKIAERVEARTKEMKEANEREIKKRDTKINEMSERLRKALIAEAAVAAAVPFGLRKTATDDLIARVSGAFTLNDKGEVVALDENGAVRRDEDDNPLSVPVFVKKLAEGSAKHLFEDNGGGGGDPAKGGQRQNNDANTVNPWDPKTLNRTTQSQMVKNNPEQAVRMARKHGVVLHITPERQKAGATGSGAR